MKRNRKQIHSCSKSREVSQTNRREGAAGVLIIVMVPVLIGVAALTVDVGYMYLVRQELQTSADAGAMAGAWTMCGPQSEGTLALSRTTAINYSSKNTAEGSADVAFGWIEDPLNPDSPFTTNPTGEVNVVKVTTKRTLETGNPVELYFARIFGIDQTDVAAVALGSPLPPVETGIIPIGLRAPDFGPVDPEIAEFNPGKDGPSEPQDGIAFRVGEEVTVFVFGKGKKSPVHLVFDKPDIPGEQNLGKILEGEDPPVIMRLGDEVGIIGEGTGHNGLGGKLANRLDDENADNDTIVIAVVDTLPDSRDDDGELEGKVVIVGFVAVHLDAIVPTSIPDPNDPQDNGKTIDSEILVGTIVSRIVTGVGGTPSPFVDASALCVPVLLR